MADERNPWSHETREGSVRDDDSWIPSSVLPTPEPRDGWRFRWIRTSVLGNPDNTNVSQKFRDGWVPVKREDHPEMVGTTTTTTTQPPVSSTESVTTVPTVTTPPISVIPSFGGMGAELVAQLLGQPCIADGDLSD